MDENGATRIAPAFVPIETPRDSDQPLYLLVLAGSTPGAMIQLAESINRIGRSPSNDIQLDDQSVSRRHALIGRHDDGTIRLVDVGSTNGTFLNGQRLQDHIGVPLKDGDRIQFGNGMVTKFIQPDPCEEQFQREMFERTVRDPLTGLYNRAYFLSEFALLAERGKLMGLGSALMMLDVDHFKVINDEYGHEVGDEVLRELAAVLRQSTRVDDLVARYGGEEFVVALPVADPDLAAERAERIRANFSLLPIEINGETVHVTASVGLAFAPYQGPSSVNQLIASADRCLYLAKKGGRNRVVFRPDAAAAIDSAFVAESS